MATSSPTTAFSIMTAFQTAAQTAQVPAYCEFTLKQVPDINGYVLQAQIELYVHFIKTKTPTKFKKLTLGSTMTLSVEPDAEMIARAMRTQYDKIKKTLSDGIVEQYTYTDDGDIKSRYKARFNMWFIADDQGNIIEKNY